MEGTETVWGLCPSTAETSLKGLTSSIKSFRQRSVHSLPSFQFCVHFLHRLFKTVGSACDLFHLNFIFYAYPLKSRCPEFQNLIFSSYYIILCIDCFSGFLAEIENPRAAALLLRKPTDEVKFRRTFHRVGWIDSANASWNKWTLHQMTPWSRRLVVMVRHCWNRLWKATPLDPCRTHFSDSRLPRIREDTLSQSKELSTPY